MNARERLERRLLIALPEDSAAAAAADLDAFRAEVLAEAKTETVAWLVKKASEQPTWDAAVLASKVDRGAVRAFLGTAHHRDAMDAHRAEVLTEAADVAEMVGSGFHDNAHSGEGNGATAVAAELRERADILTPTAPAAGQDDTSTADAEPADDEPATPGQRAAPLLRPRRATAMPDIQQFADGAPKAVTEYGITDGSGDKPEHLGDMTREQADAELAGQRRIWDEVPLALVQRTVTATAWTPTETAGA